MDIIKFILYFILAIFISIILYIIMASFKFILFIFGVFGFLLLTAIKK